MMKEKTKNYIGVTLNTTLPPFLMNLFSNISLQRNRKLHKTKSKKPKLKLNKKPNLNSLLEWCMFAFEKYSIYRRNGVRRNV